MWANPVDHRGNGTMVLAEVGLVLHYGHGTSWPSEVLTVSFL